MTDLERPVAKPTIVLREEFDDWAVLFDPDTGEAYGLDPVSVFIWRRLDGKHTLPMIVEKLDDACEDDLPDDALDHMTAFLEDLSSKGLVGSMEAA